MISSSRRALSGLSATTTTRTKTRTKTRTHSVGNKHQQQQQHLQQQHRFRGKNDIDALKPLTLTTTTTKKKKNSNNEIRANEIVQLSSSSKNSGIRKGDYDESQVFDATSLLFSLIGFDVFFLVGLTVWVRGLKKRYENAIWKIKRLESEKRDLAVAFNLEKADLADPLMNGGGVGRRIAAAAPTTVPPGGQPPTAANDVLLQGLKAERDALKQALKSVQGEMQRYARENVMLENQLEMALLEVEKLTPID